jgi:hypothetical protein
LVGYRDAYERRDAFCTTATQRESERVELLTNSQRFPRLWTYKSGKAFSKDTLGAAAIPTAEFAHPQFQQDTSADAGQIGDRSGVVTMDMLR